MILQIIFFKKKKRLYNYGAVHPSVSRHLPANADDFRMDRGVTASLEDSDAARNLVPNLKIQLITGGHLCSSTAEVKQLESEGSKNNWLWNQSKSETNVINNLEILQYMIKCALHEVSRLPNYLLSLGYFVFTTMDHLHYRLNFDLNKPRQKFHRSLKEHHKISNISISLRNVVKCG